MLFSGPDGRDTLVGNGLDNRITGGIGKDVISGRDGKDTVVETRDADMELKDSSLQIGSELDTLKSIESAELTGGGSANKLNASAFTRGPVTLDGDFGSDTLIGGTSSEDRVVVVRDADMLLTDSALKVGAETDAIIGIEQASLTGGAGANKLDASGFTKGPVILTGAGGGDTLKGGKGDDELSGGAGDDIIDGGLGTNTLVEQRDADMKLSDSKLVIGLETDLLTGIQAARLTGGNGANLLDASACNTIAVGLDGRGGVDVLKGGARGDVLDGGDGNDVIDGGNGNDRLTGGAGIDRLTGGNGDDFLDVKDGKPGDVADGGNGKDTAVADQGDTVTGVP